MFSNITYWLDKTVKKYPDKIGYADEIRGSLLIYFV